jgi:hypothetical protein
LPPSKSCSRSCQNRSRTSRLLPATAIRPNRISGCCRRFAGRNSLTRRSTSDEPQPLRRQKLTNGQSLPSNSIVLVGGYCRGRPGIRIHGTCDAGTLHRRACRSLRKTPRPPRRRFLTDPDFGKSVILTGSGAAGGRILAKSRKVTEIQGLNSPQDP